MSSCTQPRTRSGNSSTEITQGNFPGIHPTSEAALHGGLFPGGQDDAGLIRTLLADAIRASGLSRAQIADKMTYLAGRKVTERMLNNYTAESRTDYPFPLDLSRPFCTATGSDELLRAIPARLGLYVVDAEDLPLVELGRAFRQRTQAEQQIADIESRLRGGGR